MPVGSSERVRVLAAEVVRLTDERARAVAERDAAIRALARSRPKVEVARLAGLTKGRVQQIVE